MTPEINSVPSIFCWTKFGNEAGQPIDLILKRKEMERQAGNGLFAWGIGNSLGTAISVAKKQSECESIDILFTPMKSIPKRIDTHPSGIYIWLSYYAADGSIRNLPKHILITSRGDLNKVSHYALFCHSTKSLLGQEPGMSFTSHEVKNYVSGKRVGPSQVTSVVSHHPSIRRNQDAKYQVAFQAKSYGEGFVRLAHPVAVKASILRAYTSSVEATSTEIWLLQLKKLYTLAFEGRPEFQDLTFNNSD